MNYIQGQAKSDHQGARFLGCCAEDGAADLVPIDLHRRRGKLVARRPPARAAIGHRGAGGERQAKLVTSMSSFSSKSPIASTSTVCCSGVATNRSNDQRGYLALRQLTPEAPAPADYRRRAVGVDRADNCRSARPARGSAVAATKSARSALAAVPGSARVETRNAFSRVSKTWPRGRQVLALFRIILHPGRTACGGLSD
jgi:hypothetical protein